MKFWKRVDIQGQTTTVESYSHDLDVEGAVEITKEEFDTFIALLPPLITEPPHSTHISILEAVDPTKTRPAKVKRVWEGRDYFYDCFATQSVKDEFVAGKIKIGDYVLVHYDNIGEQIVIAKVWKSW